MNMKKRPTLKNMQQTNNKNIMNKEKLKCYAGLIKLAIRIIELSIEVMKNLPAIIEMIIHFFGGM